MSCVDEIYLEYIKFVGLIKKNNQLSNTDILQVIQIRKTLHKNLLINIEIFKESQLLSIQDCDDWLASQNDYLYSFFETLEEDWWELFKHHNDRLDWLWKLIALGSATTGQIILLEFSLSFFQGSGGLTGIILLITQCGFGKVLLDILKKKNRKFIERLMKLIRCSPQWEWELRCFISVLFLIGAIIIHSFVPKNYAHHLNTKASNLIRGRNFIEAQEILKLSNSIYPNNSITLHYLGFIKEYFQDFDDARMYYTESIDYIYSVNNLAQIYIVSNEYEKAVQLLLYGLKSNNHSDIVYHFLYKNLAKARLGQNFSEDAIKYLKIALKYDKQPEVFCLLGDAYEKKAEPENEIGFRQECLIQTWNKPEFDEQKNKSLRRINEITDEFEK